MKKFFIAALAAMALFASCSKDEQPADVSAQGGNVTITFSGSGADTRAFFDNTATAEAWESEINTLIVYAFNADGNLILRRDFSPSEVTARKATFSMPKSTLGTSCTFIAVANYSYGQVASLSAFNNIMEAVALKDYNGTFDEVTTGRNREKGFVMNGQTKATVADTTPLSISLKRTVAKVAVRATVSPDFSTKFNGGNVRITSATISKASYLSYALWQPGVYAPRTAFYTHTQETGGSTSHDSLFYIYENDQESDIGKVTLLLKGIYDSDGNFDTTHDQSEVDYTVLLRGSTNGRILRNGYYRVAVTINGLSGSSVETGIVVSDWDGPVTENHDLGN